LEHINFPSIPKRDFPNSFPTSSFSNINNLFLKINYPQISSYPGDNGMVKRETMRKTKIRGFDCKP
jgi:hypothetical protein